MTQYQVTLNEQTLQRLFSSDSQLAHLLEAILNQVLDAQVSEQIEAQRYERTDQRQGYRNCYKPRQLTTRVGTLTLRVPRARGGAKHTSRRLHGYMIAEFGMDPSHTPLGLVKRTGDPCNTGYYGLEQDNSLGGVL